MRYVVVLQNEEVNLFYYKTFQLLERSETFWVFSHKNCQCFNLEIKWSKMRASVISCELTKAKKSSRVTFKAKIIIL